MRSIDITGVFKNMILNNWRGSIKELVEEKIMRKIINIGREAVIVYIIKYILA
jgi:hypothetical protein